MTEANRQSPRATTRPYGDGSVFWDERRRRWVGIFTTGRDAHGRRVRRRVTGRTKTEARQRLRALQREAADGRPTPSGNLRLGAFLDRWLDEIVTAKVGSPNTLDNYRWAVDRHIKPALGSRRLRDLTPDDVDGLLRAKLGAGLGHSSVMRIRAVLVQALRYGERYGHVGRNVAQLVDLPRARVGRAGLSPWTRPVASSRPPGANVWRRPSCAGSCSVCDPVSCSGSAGPKSISSGAS